MADILLKYQSITEKSMTREERASKYMLDNKWEDKDLEDAYEQGDIDRHKIDIEKGKAFCKTFFDELVANCLPDLKDEPFYSQGLQITMEKYLKAMED